LSAQDADLDAVALVQAALDHDDEALAVVLAQCDQRAVCGVLAALAAYLVDLVRLFGPENVPLLMGGLRKAAQGLPVRLVSDGSRLSEEAP
jgi:hypothetical protein